MRGGIPRVMKDKVVESSHDCEVLYVDANSLYG